MRSSKTEKGIIYIATGDRFIKECIISASRVKKFMPDIPITLIANKKSNSKIFESEIKIKNPRYDFGDQVFHIQKSPYEKTICLDTDLYFEDSIEEIFTSLDKLDMAIAQKKVYFSSDSIDLPELNEIPISFPEYNTGLVAFKKNKRVLDLFSDWKKKYKHVVKNGQVHNQGAFRMALYNSTVRIGTLPDNYNLSLNRAETIKGKVKVFHTRLVGKNVLGTTDFRDLKKVFNMINSTENLRTILYFNNKIRLVKPTLSERLQSSLRNKGIKDTIYKGLKNIFHTSSPPNNH